MKHLIAVTVASLLLSAAPAHAQGTHTGTVSPGSNRYYSFTPSASGQFTATLSWDNQASNLLLVLVCGTGDPLTFGAAAGRLDRTARLEAGLIGLNPCLIGVSTLDIIAAFRLNMQHSSDQRATPTTLKSGGLLDARLIEYADRVLSAVQSQTR